ncbi:MAG: heavy metal-binding domain-containing protein [Novosphingobium sp.]|uniref:heavy metal-binding domain-containing protein n=1 Tax=Novosphingobium sp. TaxID=1874826 RepID=UPI0012C8FBEA|nr:heavy metal-binding domain-containing protein [Novosphingobium sp.]MPS67238.1 heavy metal-binding domain-containing protein [Novosphingobium sp.]
MSDRCGNCDAEITDGGIIKGPNRRYGPGQVAILNFVSGTQYTDICEKCGRNDYESAILGLKGERQQCQDYMTANVVDFPMMTISQVPPDADCRIKSMVTANVTVGTGLFSELSQGFSDMFGATNVASGMALKVNSGEATARSILVTKAVAMGANCIVGVDVDYGTTANNAATVNMQGTAVVIRNLDAILDTDVLERFGTFEAKLARAQEITRWLAGDFAAD